MSLSLEQCRNADARDPLADYRQRFRLPEGVIYLDGNSLGAMPERAFEHMRQVIEQEWGRGLIRSWNQAGWINLPQRLGGKIAPLIGAHPNEVVVTDSTSVNLFKLAAAALRARPGRTRVITESGNFPTDGYILQGLRDAWPQEIDLVSVPLAEIPAWLDENTALVLLTHVHYKTGAVAPMADITRQVQALGGLMLWDLSHTAGAMPVDLRACGVDLAVGCGYKYLNGGPGAPAFLYVAEALQATLRQPIAGWFGHAEPFAMAERFEPAADIRRMTTGTTAVLGASALEVGLDLFADVDLVQVREKSKALTQCMIAQVQETCADAGFELASPQDPEQRGSQVAFRHPQAYAIMQALIARGVIGDFRAPDILRFGMAPLYIGYTDILAAVDILADIMRTGEWQAPEFAQRQAVT